MVAGYLIAVGLFFGFASVFRIPFVDVQPVGRFLVLGISAVFVILGIGSFILLPKGKLKKEGASITEIRQEAIEKMNDPQLLSRIATKDANAKLRELAQDRLKELKGVN
jgi:hypothetical protein